MFTTLVGNINVENTNEIQKNVLSGTEIVKEEIITNDEFAFAVSNESNDAISSKSLSSFLHSYIHMIIFKLIFMCP